MTPTTAPAAPTLMFWDSPRTVCKMVAFVSAYVAGPKFMKGWPKATSRLPSRYVSVPIAYAPMSPRSSATPIALPGSSGIDGGSAADDPPAIGSTPIGSSTCARDARAASSSPDRNSGVAAGTATSVPGAVRATARRDAATVMCRITWPPTRSGAIATVRVDGTAAVRGRSRSMYSIGVKSPMNGSDAWNE